MVGEDYTAVILPSYRGARLHHPAGHYGRTDSGAYGLSAFGCDRILDKNGVRPITNTDVYNATRSAEDMSSQELRVLALAYREGDEKPQETGMIFAGLSAEIDPPKEGVRETVDECHGAGIDVAMITGDHKITAFAIAKELNIADSLDQCISGKEIDEYDFRQEIRSAEEYGQSEIERMLDELDAQYVLAHLDLKGYGKDLIEYRDIRITPYGSIERRDGLPIITIEEQRARDQQIMSSPQM